MSAPVDVPPRNDAASPQEATELNRAALESLRDSPIAKPERTLSPSNALLHRKPRGSSSAKKKSGKKGRSAQPGQQISAVKADELAVISAADEPVPGADEVLNLADDLLDQLELEEQSELGRDAGLTSESSAASPSTSPRDKASALVDSIGSRIAFPFRSGPSRQAQRKERREQAWKQQTDNARREAAGTKDQAKEEREGLERKLAAEGLVTIDIPPDGHCMFSAVAEQVNLFGLAQDRADHRSTRAAAAAYMRDHPNDYMPYLQAEEAGGEGEMSFDDYALYCNKIESSGLWGGQTELNALAQVYRNPIYVYQGDAPLVKLGDDAFAGREPMRIVYYRALYGLGEHYNSLHRKSAG